MDCILCENCDVYAKVKLEIHRQVTRKYIDQSQAFNQLKHTAVFINGLLILVVCEFLHTTDLFGIISNAESLVVYIRNIECNFFSKG